MVVVPGAGMLVEVGASVVGARGAVVVGVVVEVVPVVDGWRWEVVVIPGRFVAVGNES